MGYERPAPAGWTLFLYDACGLLLTHHQCYHEYRSTAITNSRHRTEFDHDAHLGIERFNAFDGLYAD
ncbi:MAG: hypothetical protein CMJ18_01540 [Phycisphaeraceae bacterium]|nr:hypothetical protein [Phycisphaeraceae bacterium]